MKQIMQNLGTGDIELADVPCPHVKPGQLLIRTRASLVSSGTERALSEYAKASLVEKAVRQPERVQAVLERMLSDGLTATIDAVRNRLNTPLPVGYCNAGVVIDVGAGLTDFAVGDRVVSNGHHAEVVCVPKNLCAKVPDSATDEEASFAVIGAIGLQGMRLAQPALGETFVVTGLGLIGLVTVQLLRAHGCRVIGIDYDAQRLALARHFGAETVDLSRDEDPLVVAKAYTRGAGVDAVLITAATESEKPVHQAAQMCRKRGRIVLVGVAGLQLSRADFYEKELSFQVSCSYGPGRYDPIYEGGQDYPFGFVRWTLQRNFDAVLGLIADRRIDVKPLVSHRFELEQASEAYRVLTTDRSSLGIMLRYAAEVERPTTVLRATTVELRGTVPAIVPAVVPTFGVVGAGNYAAGVLIPAFRAMKVRLKAVASATGITGLRSGRRFGFERITTDVDVLLRDPEIDALVIATRHDSHADFVSQALAAGKHVFVEKPIAIDRAGLERIKLAYLDAGRQKRRPLLMVGFNRRFAPQVAKIKSLLQTEREPKLFVMTVNAGAIPRDHWTQDPQIGGGRIIGEACHFIDLLRFLAAHPIIDLRATALSGVSGAPPVRDNVDIALTFADGSIGSIHYVACGHRAFPKERLEVFCGGRVLQLDNFRRLLAFGWPLFSGKRLWRQDKGNKACAAAFVNALRTGGPSPIPFEELVEVAELTFQATEQLSNATTK